MNPNFVKWWISTYKFMISWSLRTIQAFLMRGSLLAVAQFYQISNVNAMAFYFSYAINDLIFLNYIFYFLLLPNIKAATVYTTKQILNLQKYILEKSIKKVSITSLSLKYIKHSKKTIKETLLKNFWRVKNFWTQGGLGPNYLD